LWTLGLHGGQVVLSFLSFQVSVLWFKNLMSFRTFKHFITLPMSGYQFFTCVLLLAFLPLSSLITWLQSIKMTQSVI
jgi:hypothetical protein